MLTELRPSSPARPGARARPRLQSHVPFSPHPHQAPSAWMPCSCCWSAMLA